MYDSFPYLLLFALLWLAYYTASEREKRLPPRRAEYERRFRRSTRLTFQCTLLFMFAEVGLLLGLPGLTLQPVFFHVILAIVLVFVFRLGFVLPSARLKTIGGYIGARLGEDHPRSATLKPRRVLSSGLGLWGRAARILVALSLLQFLWRAVMSRLEVTESGGELHLALGYVAGAGLLLYLYGRSLGPMDAEPAAHRQDEALEHAYDRLRSVRIHGFSALAFVGVLSYLVSAFAAVWVLGHFELIRLVSLGLWGLCGFGYDVLLRRHGRRVAALLAEDALNAGCEDAPSC